MQAFQPLAEKTMVERLLIFLRTSHAPAVAHLLDDTLRRRIRGAVAKGRSYGFTWETALMGFLIFMFEVGPNFDAYPTFKSALEETREIADENSRIREIFSRVTDQDWEAAQSEPSELLWGSLETAE
jgi:multimeric flavodoxin WrbA